ncbi:MAG TPA: ATP-binding protein [Noviherbaspirillum sp.]
MAATGNQNSPRDSAEPHPLLIKQDELRLHAMQEEYLRIITDAVPVLIAYIDTDERYRFVNAAYETWFCRPRSEIVGRTLREMLSQIYRDIRRHIAAALAGERTHYEIGLRNGMGQQRHVLVTYTPDMAESGIVRGFSSTVIDITERARVEIECDELLLRERSARIQAETAARARDEFLAIVSHELRAPLNSIQSWAHVLENYLQDAASAPLAQRALAGIKTGVGQQVRLIEDLLDVTRMMSGKLRLVKQPLALLPLLQAAVESVQPMAAAQSIDLICTYRITSEQIEGDSDRVQQIFWNLLSNAIKFTQKNGHVWLTASHTDHNICVTVRDDGIGISPEFLPQLFDRFSQEDTSSTRGHSGLGLGLFLVRHLIELHGGSVQAESEGEGCGTTFIVHFPLRVRTDKYTTTLEDSSAVAGPLPSLKGLHILLIDDQAEARESLTVLLSAAGANVFAAESAMQVLAWLPTLADNMLPDVLICDIAMPGEDGYAVLRKLRAWKPDGENAPLQRLPALALTAFAQREDRIRALTAGFQMHITKPVAAEELIVVIDAMVTR